MIKSTWAFAIALLASLYGHAAEVHSQHGKPGGELPRTIQPEIERASRDKNEKRAREQEPGKEKVTEGDVSGSNQKIASPIEAPQLSTTGKRDPFRPLSLNVKTNSHRRENLSPLERYEVGQLKLVGIIWDQKEPRALVEDSTGLGYIVKVGTQIGVNDGKIKTIKPNQIVIEETYSDFYGSKKRREINMKLSSE